MPTCPKCASADIRYREKRADWFCDGCDHSWAAPAPTLDAGARAAHPLQIFLSYGHDERTVDAIRIKTDLEARGHTVWFDDERLRAGRDWESFIEQGLRDCDVVVLLMTPHAVRRRKSGDPDSRDGYCLNELAKAIEKNKTIIPVLMVTLEDGPPTSICRIQYLDLTDAIPTAEREERYRVRFDRLVRAIEEKELDFGGGQARLQRLLGPLDFTRQMERHIASFTGRLWLLADIDAWLAAPTGARVLWLTGGPGIGKSAIATHLCHRRGEVIAHHFCVHGDDDKASPTRAILSIAFQMAAHLPEYHRRLQALDLEEEVAKNPATLFDRIVVQPLSKDFPVPTGGPRLVIIDALDEATRVDVGGRSQNAIAQIVHEQWQHVPAWLRLFLTSRPESELQAELQHLGPLVLDAQRPENLADIRAFLATELPRRNVPHDEPTIAAIMERSEGIFLYATELLNEIDAGRETLSRLDELPQGMKGHYRKFFTRQFPDLTVYRQQIRPMLECICAAREPLPLGVLGQATGAERVNLRAQLASVGSLFPIRVGPEATEDSDTVAPFHKSVRDWLVDIDAKTRLAQAGNYAVDLTQGQKRLAEACMRAYRLGPEHMSAYELRHAPGHLVAAGRAADAAEVMTDFGYHHARLERLGAGDVVQVAKDFFALLRTEQSTRRRDAVQTWQRFHAQCAHLLRRSGIHPEVELLQQGFAHADESPVTKSAETWLESHDSRHWWFRKLGRPKSPARTACTLVLEGHKTNGLLHVDGRRAVSASKSIDNRVGAWDLDTGECLHTFPADAENMVLSPDGRRLVTVGRSDHAARVWDFDTGKCLHTLEGCTKVSFHPNGRQLLTCGSNEVQLWDIETGERLRVLAHGVFEGEPANVDRVWFRADGRIMVRVHNTTMWVWDLEVGTCLEIPAAGYVHFVAFHPDGRRVATSCPNDKTVRVWDLQSGICQKVLRGSATFFYAVAIHPNGRQVLAGYDAGKGVQVWDIDTGQCTLTLDGDVLGARAIHADGRRVVTTLGSKLMIWDLQSGERLGVLECDDVAVHSVALSHDWRRAVTWGWNNSLRVWDLTAPPPPIISKAHTHSVSSALVHTDGNTAVTSDTGGLARIWNMETGVCLTSLDGHSVAIRAIAQSQDGQRLATGSDDGTIRLWNLPGGECYRVLEGHTGEIRGFTFSADEQRLVSWSSADTPNLVTLELLTNGAERSDSEELAENSIRVWNLEMGVCERIIEGAWLFSLVGLLADGRRLVTRVGTGFQCAARPGVRVWDIESGACLKVLLDVDPRHIKLHPDGRRVVTVTDGTIMVLNVDTGECVTASSKQTADVWMMVLSSDGETVLTKQGRYGGDVCVWDLTTGECLRTLTGEICGAFVHSAAASVPSHGQLMISWNGYESHRKMICLWELGEGKRIAAWSGSGKEDFAEVALGTCSSNGRVRLVAGCSDGSVLFLELMPPGPLTRTTLATWSPANPLVATALDSGAVILHQWHPASAHLEEIAHLAPSGDISSLRFSLDGTRLQLLSPDGAERILDATTLQPAAPPDCAWAPSLATSPDRAWRADIDNGRLKIISVGE